MLKSMALPGVSLKGGQDRKTIENGTEKGKEWNLQWKMECKH